MSQKIDCSREPGEISDLLSFVAEGNNLSVSQAENVFDAFMNDSASPTQMAAFLVALKVKGVVPTEVAGGVRALRKAMIPVAVTSKDRLIDTCGTGGGDITTFNISTAAALVACAAGARIAKHGNRSFTSKSGSADVLEALGVNIDLSPESMSQILEDVGIVFMFAPLLHPAMRHVGPVRKELGFSTVMNILGPLTNPASVSRQLVGVSDRNLVGLVAETLRELGHDRAMVVYGQPGMDELSPLGSTVVADLSGNDITEYVISPADYGMEVATAEELAGGDPIENAEVVSRVLKNRGRVGARNAVVLNAAAALYVSGVADTMEVGVDKADKVLEDGKALWVLDRLRRASA
ncbi:MAG: anthranilate phosphoribosyltransferase [Longimicrobiales bacterium]